jgi:hypothetical protein
LVDAVETLLCREIPDKLWHYSSFLGFQGIVDSGNIFATDIRFLNDSEEFQHARRILDQIADEISFSEPTCDIVKQGFKNLIKWAFEAGPLNSTSLQVFVACFSEAEDQLGQWRGYSKSSSGVSVALDLRNIRDSRAKDGLFVFAPCIYEDEEKRILLREVAEGCLSQLRGLIKAAYAAGMKHQQVAFDMELVKKEDPDGPDREEKLDKSTMWMIYHLLRVTALMKNSAFREEKEWRLVLPALKNFRSVDPIKFRPGSISLVPYTTYSLRTTDTDRLPLGKVILGPGNHEHSVEAVSQFLRIRDIQAEVKNSIVPYRPS